MRQPFIFSCYIILMLAISGCTSADNNHTFEIKNGQFLYDGKAMQINGLRDYLYSIPGFLIFNKLVMFSSI